MIKGMSLKVKQVRQALYYQWKVMIYMYYIQVAGPPNELFLQISVLMPLLLTRNQNRC